MELGVKKERITTIFVTHEKIESMNPTLRFSNVQHLRQSPGIGLNPALTANQIATILDRGPASD